MAPVDSSALRSLSKLAKANSNASWSFQFEKSGIKYSRISTPRSFPLSASKHSQSLIVSKSTRRIGKSLRRFSCPLLSPPYRISVLTHSLFMLSGDSTDRSLS